MKKALFCILTIIFILFSLFEFVFLWVLPKQLNLNTYTPKIIELIKNKTNIDTQIDNISFETFSDFSINFNVEKLILKANDKELIYGQNLNLRLNILPLILKDIDIKTFSADALKIAIERNNNGQYNINNIVLAKEKGGMEFKLSHARLDLENYEINYNDKFYKNSYKLKGDYFIINKFNPQKYIDMYILGNLNVNKDAPIPLKFNVKAKLPLQKYIDNKDFKLDILIPTFDLSILSSYIKEYSDKTLAQLSGKITANIKTTNEITNNDIKIFVVSNDTKYLRKSKDMSVISNGKYTIVGTLEASNEKLNIWDLNIKGKDVDATLKGKVSDFDNLKKIKSDLNIQIKNTRSDTLYWLVPSELPTEFDSIRKAKKYGFYSDVNANMFVKGKGERPDVTGKLMLTQVYITKPFAPHVPKATIDIDFKGQYLHVNSHTNSDINEYVDVLGNIELYGEENADLHIYSTPIINLLYTYQVLIPLHDTLGFELGPLPVMNFYDGIGNIDLYVKGNLDDAVLDGYFQCFNTAVSMDGLDAKLSKAKAKLDFTHKTYHFETSQAFQNNSPVKIIGNGDVDGKFDFNVISDNFDAKEGLSILKNSEMFSDFKYLLNIVDSASGKAEFKVNINGKVDTFDFAKIKDLINYSAYVKLKNIQGSNKKQKLMLSNLNGIAEIANDKFNFDLKGLINNNKFVIKTKSNMKHIDLDAYAENFNIQTFIPKDKSVKLNLPPITTKADIKLKYKGLLNKIGSKNINVNAQFKNTSTANISSIKINSGTINISKGNAKFNKISLKCFASTIVLDGDIKNIFSKSRTVNINSDINRLELYDINRLISYLPKQENSTNVINAFLSRMSGNLTGNITYSKKSLNGYLDANSIIIQPKKIQQAIVIGKTRINIHNNNAEIRPFTFHFYQIPVFVKLSVNSILNNPKINLYTTTKITPVFLDSFLNNYLSYPLKLTGEGTLTTTLQGNKNDLETHVAITIPPQSDISYLGVNLGDIYDNKELFLHAKIKPNSINIKKFDYKRYIKTQNGRLKPLHIINIIGTINKNGNKYTLAPMLIKTSTPASAKFFNMIFKKSIIKSGLFDCDLKLTGDVYNPKILGTFSASNIFMPTYNTKIYDLFADFNSSILDLRVRANSYNSEVEVNSIIKNSVQTPIEINNINVIAKYVNLDVLTKELTQITYNEHKNPQANINSLINNVSKMNIIIHKGTLTAKNIFLQGIMAKNLELDFNLNKNLLLTIDKIFFAPNQGVVSGKVTYNFRNTNLTANLFAKNVNANRMAKSVFLMEDQIDGNLSGKINIKTSGIDEEQKVKNLNGNVEFKIENGKMPKLGSLEYLLRASNLLESGVTGVSINSVLQLIIPMHTGNFNTLEGSFSLTNGIADNINIYTRGKSLNLYLYGTLDLVTSIAHINVWGKLDKNIKTPLGLLGNASLNSVFDLLIPWVNLSDPQNEGLIKNINKIPGIELSTQKNRIFRAIINGNIESDNFVEKFEWIKN